MHRKVLLVDDDPDVRSVLTLLLQASGWEVVEAANAEAALRLVRDMDSDADVVVTDLRMPGMSGIELARQYDLVTDDHRVVPMVAITADTSELRHRAEASGRFEVVLAKPLAPRELLDALDRAVETEGA